MNLLIGKKPSLKVKIDSARRLDGGVAECGGAGGANWGGAGQDNDSAQPPGVELGKRTK